MTDVPTIQRLETATIHSWPAISSAMDGMWLARFARGYTRRANSIQCLDPADDGDAMARLGRMIDLCLLNARDPIFRVTPLSGPRLVAALDADRWVPEDVSRVLTMPLLRDRPAGDAHVYDATDANFIEAISGLMGIDRQSREIMTILFGLIAYRSAGLIIRDAAGEPAAGVLAVNASSIGVFHCVIVRLDARGQGLGRRIMEAGLGWTKEAGATQAALQVLAANTPAVNLYTSLGFSEAYGYHYCRPA